MNLADAHVPVVDDEVRAPRELALLLTLAADPALPRDAAGPVGAPPEAARRALPPAG